MHPICDEVSLSLCSSDTGTKRSTNSNKNAGEGSSLNGSDGAVSIGPGSGSTTSGEASVVEGIISIEKGMIINIVLDTETPTSPESFGISSTNAGSNKITLEGSLARW